MNLEEALEIIDKFVGVANQSSRGFNLPEYNLKQIRRSFLDKRDSDSLDWLLPSTDCHIRKVAGYGGEDCGSDYWRVYEVKSELLGTGFIKFHGYYSSWDGVEWKEPFMVKPVEITVIEWSPT